VNHGPPLWNAAMKHDAPVSWRADQRCGFFIMLESFAIGFFISLSDVFPMASAFDFIPCFAES
jgi:hypothetical protein